MVNENYRMKKIAKLVRDKKRILDLGWADIPNGYLTNEFVTGLDLRERQLPGNYSGSAIGNAMNLPKPFEADYFDAIIAGELIEHLEQPVDFLRRCHESLKRNGSIVLSTPNPNSLIERTLTLSLCRKYFYTPHHVMLYPQRWLIRIMELSGFSNIRILSGGFPLPILGLVPFPRPWCYQTIAIGEKR
ncbi:MAG: methyltransferase domain-containing protein [Candidatus Sabulitectum sp.]|nr:methyltransferase domain-containing protein [Candidatus Sabulitectum sp.]